MDLAFSLFGIEITLPVVTLGVILGMTYGILAVGLVLIYRSNRIINFAHGEMGAFGAAFFGLAVVKWNLPYWLAFPIALLVSAGISGVAEVAVIRRLRNAPRLMSIVATLGVAQFLLLFSLVINSQARTGQLYPQPSFLPDFNVGVLRVTPAHTGMLVLTPLMVAALVWFLRRSHYGLAIQGAADNPDAARLAGIFSSRMSTLAWMIAGAISAHTAILFSPTRGFISAESFGPALLLRALVAAVVARMTSLPIALAAGVGVGVVEQVLLWNRPSGGLVEAVLFGVILVALLLQRRVASSREGEKGSWAAVQAWPAMPEAFRQVWTIRNLGRLLAAAGLIVAVLLVAVMTNATAVILTAIAAFGIVGLSVGIVTGLGGQLTLGQFAIAAVGAVVSWRVSAATGNFVLSFLGAGLASAGVSVLIGLPALRIRGLMLAVTTLSFALATQAWLLQQPWMLGEGVGPGRPIIGDLALDTGKSYYLFAVAVLIIALWLARNIRRGGIGRRLIAIRDNEDNARAFTVNATAVKLQGFALAGFVAGIGGATFAHLLSRISPTTFPVGNSIDVVALAVIGGIGTLVGPLIGAFYIIGVPEFLPLDSAGLAATSLGWLILILYAPGGLAQILRPIRDRLLDLLARRAGIDPDAARAEASGWDERAQDETRVTIDLRDRPVRDARLPLDVPPGDVLLEATGLRKHYGGVKAVDGVDLTVRRGEIVGLIGPNGAGKTTTFELLGGFTPADEGRIVYAGQDITRLTPEQRGHLGLIRSFQDAGLFPTMTVLDAVALAQERVAPTRLGPALLGATRHERAKESYARDLITAMGLERYRNKQISELSTGTRRITELACLVALEPDLLLLDEPSSGIAQRETEALGGLLRDLQDVLDVTMLIIEHDIPLIMGLADRIVAMDTGTVVAAGSPDHVRNHPAVVSSYLGGDVDAIERSGGDHHRQTNGLSMDRVLGVLAGVQGLGPAKREALAARFTDPVELVSASDDQLLDVPGVGPALASRIREALDELRDRAPV